MRKMGLRCGRWRGGVGWLLGEGHAPHTVCTSPFNNQSPAPPPQVLVFSHLVVVRSFFSRFALSGDWAEEGDGGGLGRGGGRGCGGRGALTLPLQQLRSHSLVDIIEFFRDAVVRVAGFQGTEVHFGEEVTGLFDVAVEEEFVSFPLSLDLQ